MYYAKCSSFNAENYITLVETLTVVCGNTYSKTIVHIQFYKLSDQIVVLHGKTEKTIILFGFDCNLTYILFNFTVYMYVCVQSASRYSFVD